MAILPGIRIRENGVFGTITDNPLTAGSTTFNSADLARLSAVAGNHALITLDPLREFGDPEIVMVTAHTAAATVATIQRGMFGTSARSHPQGTLWVHAACDNDFVEIVTSLTRPSDQYEGQLIYETDTDRFSGHNGSNWETVAQLGAWASYVPTDTNVTLGNGTRTAKFVQLGKTVHFSWSITFGTTTAFTGTVSVGLPVAAAATGRWSVAVYMLDSGTQNFSAGAFIDSGGSSAQPLLAAGGGINSTIPFTWAVNDRLVVSGTYEAA